MDRDAVVREIYAAIRRANEFREPDQQILCSEQSVLYGQEGALDSMGLLSLLLDVEETVNAAAGRDVVLADERAMAQRRNPFRDVRSLADYMMVRLTEDNPCQKTP